MGWLGSLAGGLTGNIGLYALAGAIAVGAGAWGYERVQRADSDSMLANERSEWTKREMELSNRALAAEQSARAKEAQREKDHKEITDAADKRVAAVEAAAAASAAAASRSLHNAAQAAAAAGRRACTNPALAGGSSSTSDPIGVLADVFGRADERAVRLAAEADRRRIRAIACEDAYEALRK